MNAQQKTCKPCYSLPEQESVPFVVTRASFKLDVMANSHVQSRVAAGTGP